MYKASYEITETMNNVSLNDRLLNLFDLNEDCLKKIGEFVIKDNKERIKEECNAQDLCYICEEEPVDIFCNICEYMCCVWCHESRPDMFLTKEHLDIFMTVHELGSTPGEDAANELEELKLENEDWLLDTACNDYDVCHWCSECFVRMERTDTDE